MKFFEVISARTERNAGNQQQREDELGCCHSERHAANPFVILAPENKKGERAERRKEDHNGQQVPARDKVESGGSHQRNPPEVGRSSGQNRITIMASAPITTQTA